MKNINHQKKCPTLIGEECKNYIYIYMYKKINNKNNKIIIWQIKLKY